MNIGTLLNAIPRPKSAIAQRLARGGFWTLMAEGATRVGALASVVVVARWLGVHDYGAFALVQATLATLLTFAQFGMGHTSGRFIAAYRDSQPERIEGVNSVALTFSLATGFIAASALLVASPAIATDMLRAPHLADPLRLVAPVLFLYAITGAAQGVLIGFEAFKEQARIAWICGGANFVSLVSGVVLGGLQGACIGLIASEALRCTLMILAAHKTMRTHGLDLFKFGGGGQELPVLWQFSLPVFLTSLLNAPVMWVCQAIIARQSEGLAQIGLYDAAQKWMTIVTVAPIAASAAFAPVLANLMGNANTQRQTTRQLALVQLAFTAVPAAAVALGSHWATMLFGPAFAPAAPIIVLTMILAPAFVVNNLYWRALISNGRAWISLCMGLTSAALMLGFTWAGRTGGAPALVEAMIAANLVTLLLMAAIMEWDWRRSAAPAAPQQAGT